MKLYTNHTLNQRKITNATFDIYLISPLYNNGINFRQRIQNACIIVLTSVKAR